MKAPNDRVDEFVELWWRAFGERISPREVRARARQLLEIYRTVASDLAPDDHEAAAPSIPEANSEEFPL
jgi:hypothetical protein